MKRSLQGPPWAPVVVAMVAALFAPGAIPAAARSDSYSPERYPPPPASFDPASIQVPTGGWDLGPPAVAAIDGTSPRSAAPARPGDARMLTPDAWIQPPFTSCRDGGDHPFELVHPGRAPVRLPAWVNGWAPVADGALWSGRFGRLGAGAERVDGRGIWRIPLDGSPATLVWDLRDPELYTTIVVSDDGARIAVAPYTGQMMPLDWVPPRPRVRIEGRGTFTLARWLEPVGWDALGGLILRRGDHTVRWDPTTGAIRRLDRTGEDGETTVLPGGGTIVFEGPYVEDGPATYRLLDVRTGRDRVVHLVGDAWGIDESSTADFAVFYPWLGPFPESDPRTVAAIVSVREGWVGYLLVRSLPDGMLPSATVAGTDGRPRPPAWFDPGVVRYLGSPDGDPDDLSHGLWTGAIDGSGLVKISGSAVDVVAVGSGAFAWTEPATSGDPDGPLRLFAASGTGTVRHLLDDVAGSLLADPDGTAVWALRQRATGGPAWWRIPVDGTAPTAAPRLPADAIDIRLHAGGDPVAWSRVEDGVLVHAWWSADPWDGSPARVQASADPIIGFTCDRRPVTRSGGVIHLLADDETVMTVRTDDPTTGMPADQSTIETFIGPIRGRHAATQVLALVTGRCRPENDLECEREPPTSIRLTPGDWALTELGTDRYLVLRDAARDRFGVYDRGEAWFAEVPFVPAKASRIGDRAGTDRASC